MVRTLTVKVVMTCVAATRKHKTVDEDTRTRNNADEPDEINFDDDGDGDDHADTG